MTNPPIDKTGVTQLSVSICRGRRIFEKISP
jgi:hypothetical protein